MKTFIALTFLGILTYAYANSSGLTKCKPRQAMTDFDAPRFFTGEWCVSHVQKRATRSVCQPLSALTSSEGKYALNYTEVNRKKEPTIVQCKGEEGAEQKFTFKCTKTGSKSTTDAVAAIIDTDYDDYALFYWCFPVSSKNIRENYLVLRRQNRCKNGIPENLSNSTIGFKSCEKLKTVRS
uniref:Salivary lipocalin n=1 Tax=Triatoma matogrossensis TaxID=162370 RepID=E2J769_9HEMI